MVCRPNSRSVAVSQGKGLDLDAARASGLMEAVVGWHAERIDRPLRLASARDLRRRCRIADTGRLARIKAGRFHDDLAMLWIEGQDLLSGEAVWLPFETVHASFTLPLPTGSGCFPATTNGLASGNHVLEAVCHGLCEVIERDATALWNRRGARARAAARLDLSSVDDADCRGLLDRLAAAGVAAAAWDTTSDVGVPAVYAALVDPRAGAHLGIGAGCHPSPAVALLRALTEAVQVRTTYVTGARDDLSPDEFAPTAIHDKQRRAAALMAQSAPARPFAAVSGLATDTLAEDLEAVLARLAAAGIAEVLAVDLTDSGLGIPVVRVVVPGLEAPDDSDDYLPGSRAQAVSRGP
jgi:ribosomal protein S12 methylthiotransferase accessory factor